MKISIAIASLLGALVTRAALGQATPPVMTAPAPVQFETAAYVLGPNDVVRFKVFQEEDLEVKGRISQDGTIGLPLLNSVKIAGKTVEQAQAQLRDLLAQDYLVNPQVTLTVEEFARKRFLILGQVQKPGAYEAPKDQSVSLLQAIAMAGGFLPQANPSNVIVCRLAGGRKEILRLDTQAMTATTAANSFEVRFGDTITVGEKPL